MMNAVIGVPWFKRDQYQRIQEVMADAHLLPSTFDKWLDRAEDLIKDIRRLGSRPLRVHIDPDVFAEWCRLQDCRPDGKARLEFARVIAEEQLSAQGC